MCGISREGEKAECKKINRELRIRGWKIIGKVVAEEPHISDALKCHQHSSLIVRIPKMFPLNCSQKLNETKTQIKTKNAAIKLDKRPWAVLDFLSLTTYGVLALSGGIEVN